MELHLPSFALRKSTTLSSFSASQSTRFKHPTLFHLIIMRGFSFIAVAAAAALSLVPSVFAVPVDAKVGAGAGALIHAREPVDVGAGVGAGAKVHVRDYDQCSAILADVKVDLKVQLDVLSAFTYLSSPGRY